MILPFFVPDIDQGFATASGIAQLNSVGLQLEFEVKENWFGRRHYSRIKMQIPYCEISHVVLRSNWFVTRLLIQTCCIATVSQFPEQESGKITLGIARGDRTSAKALATLLQLNILELELNFLSESFARFSSISQSGWNR